MRTTPALDCFSFLWTLPLVATALAGCGTAQTSGGETTGVQQQSVCATDPRGETYAVGLSQTAMDGALKMSFVNAEPAPPALDTNVWTVKLTDGQGAAMTGATITAKPFMPDHGHGSSIVPSVAPMGSDGTYAVDGLYFFMPGIWQTTFDVTPSGGAMDSVVFTFCIDG